MRVMLRYLAIGGQVLSSRRTQVVLRSFGSMNLTFSASTLSVCSNSVVSL